MKKFIRKLIIAFISFFCLNLSLSGQSWHGLKQHDTQKFRIVYAEKHFEYAQEVALWADKVYKEVINWLPIDEGSRLFKRDHPILIMMSDRGDLFNAFQAEDWITLFVTPPLSPLFKQNNWLQLVFAHELTHYITFNYLPSIWQGSRDFIEPYINALVALSVSGNLVEGATVFAESNVFEVSRSGRGNNPFFELAMRSIILDDRYPNYWQSLAPFYRGSDPSLEGLHYLVGYYFYDYLEQEYGADLIERVWKAFHKNFVSNEAALETISGKTIQQLYNGMRTKLRKRFFANGGNLQARSNVFQGNAHYGLPIFTEKGVFVVQKKPNNQRFLLFGNKLLFEGDTTPQGNTAPLFKEEWPSLTLELSANKDGSILVADDYFSRDGVSLLRGVGIYKNGRWSLLTKERGLGEAALSPDGKTLLASKVKGLDFSLVRLDMETGISEELLAFEGVAFNQPAWNKEGDRFLLRLSASNEELSELWEFSWPRLNARLLYSSATKVIEQAFYDSENNIYFISDYQSHPAVVKLEQKDEQTELKVVAEDRIGILQAKWDNNASLYYQSYEQGRRVIKKISASNMAAEAYLLEVKQKAEPQLFTEQQLPSKPQLQNLDAQDIFDADLDLSRTMLAFSDQDYGAFFSFRSLLGVRMDVGLFWHSSGQPKPIFNLSFSPLNTFGYLPAHLNFFYSIERVTLGHILGVTQQFEVSFTPIVHRLGTGFAALMIRKNLQWSYLESYKKPFTLFEPIPPRRLAYHYWNPQLTLSWVWDRQWGSGTGAGISWLNLFPFVDYIEPNDPLEQLGYETALSIFYDLPLFDNSNLKLETSASLASQRGVAESNLPPPLGWQKSLYREPTDISLQYGLVFSVPFYFTQDKPLFHYALHSWELAFAATMKNNTNFGASLDRLWQRYQLYLGGSVGLELRLNRVILPSIDLELGWLALSHLPVKERWSFTLKIGFQYL